LLECDDPFGFLNAIEFKQVVFILRAEPCDEFPEDSLFRSILLWDFEREPQKIFGCCAGFLAAGAGGQSQQLAFENGLNKRVIFVFSYFISNGKEMVRSTKIITTYIISHS
jgi:hypothetical protein